MTFVNVIADKIKDVEAKGGDQKAVVETTNRMLDSWNRLQWAAGVGDFRDAGKAVSGTAR